MNFCIGAPLVGRKWHVRLTNSFFPRKHVVWFCNLHHLNFDHLKLNRSFIDCMLGRKSTNGTFASFSANSFQNRCYCNLKTQRRKIIETMISFDNAVHFRTKTEEVMTLQWCAQKISLWITDSSLVTIFVFIRLLREEQFVNIISCAF